MRKINCKLYYLDSCLLLFNFFFVATGIKKITQNINCGTLMCSRHASYMLVVGQASGLVVTFNIGIFSDTISVIKSNFSWSYYTLNFICSLYFQWVWHYFKVTAVSNSINWKFYVLIRLSWNFVEFFKYIKQVVNCFWLSHIFKGDNWRISWFDKTFTVGFFTDTAQARFFKLSIIITLFGVYQFIPSLMTLNLLQGHGCIRIISCRLKKKIFLSAVV